MDSAGPGNWNIIAVFRVYLIGRWEYIASHFQRHIEQDIPFPANRHLADLYNKLLPGYDEAISYLTAY